MSDIVAKLKDGTRTVRWSDDRVRLEAAAEIERLRVRVAELEGQHKGLVIQNATLRQRPDLPADRIPAANRVAELEAERGRWKAEALAWRAGTYTIHGDIQVDYHYFGSMLDNLRAARAANGENTNE